MGDLLPGTVHYRLDCAVRVEWLHDRWALFEDVGDVLEVGNHVDVVEVGELPHVAAGLIAEQTDIGDDKRLDPHHRALPNDRGFAVGDDEVEVTGGDGGVYVPVENVDAAGLEKTLDFIELRERRELDPEPIPQPVMHQPKRLRCPVLDKDVFETHRQPEAPAPALLRFVQVLRGFDPSHSENIRQSGEHVFVGRGRKIQIHGREVRDLAREQWLGQVVGIIGGENRVDSGYQLDKCRAVRNTHLMHHVTFVPAEMSRRHQRFRTICREDAVQGRGNGNVGRRMKLDAIESPVFHLQLKRVEDILALGPEKYE